ncbi:hypothetical protein AZ15_4272, partial [Bordetella bronchiseptica A1-7]
MIEHGQQAQIPCSRKFGAMGRARGGRVGGRHGVTAFILSLTSAY